MDIEEGALAFTEELADSEGGIELQEEADPESFDLYEASLVSDDEEEGDYSEEGLVQLTETQHPAVVIETRKTTSKRRSSVKQLPRVQKGAIERIAHSEEIEGNYGKVAHSVPLGVAGNLDLCDQGVGVDNLSPAVHDGERAKPHLCISKMLVEYLCHT